MGEQALRGKAPGQGGQTPGDLKRLAGCEGGQEDRGHHHVIHDAQEEPPDCHSLRQRSCEFPRSIHLI